MWNCRACSSSPFKTIFGGGEPDTSSSGKPKKSKTDVSRTEVSGDYTSEGSYTHDADSYTETWNAPSQAELLVKCTAWENYVHPRAKQFWTTSKSLQQVLANIAKSVDRQDDPVLGDDPQRCVFWHGEVGGDGYPIIRLRKPGEPEETATYVCRALVFLYADLDAYEELRKKPAKAPFTMACEHRMCVNLIHISLDD